MKYWLLIFVLPLLACSAGLSGLSDKELRRRHYECEHSVSLSAAEIQVCNNIKRECERRAAEGNFVC